MDIKHKTKPSEYETFRNTREEAKDVKIINQGKVNAALLIMVIFFCISFILLCLVILFIISTPKP